jgi:putative FmdB family regulatory protein
MPTYEYACPSGHAFERFEKMSDAPRTKCPECGRTALRKISGGAGLVFKGSGFYITDYGKDGKGPRKADKPESPNPQADKTKETGPEKGKTESSKTSPKAKE